MRGARVWLVARKSERARVRGTPIARQRAQTPIAFINAQTQFFYRTANNTRAVECRHERPAPVDDTLVTLRNCGDEQ